MALKINSVYSKRKLLSIHENVRVLRYPDHFSSGVYLWYGLVFQVKFLLSLFLIIFNVQGMRVGRLTLLHILA